VVVASLLLIVAAAAVLVLGWLTGNALLVVGSIGISVVAALLLYLGARQLRRRPVRPVEKKPAARSDETAVLSRVPAEAAAKTATKPAKPAKQPVTAKPPKQSVAADRGRRKPPPAQESPFASSANIDGPTTVIAPVGGTAPGGRASDGSAPDGKAEEPAPLSTPAVPAQPVAPAETVVQAPVTKTQVVSAPPVSPPPVRAPAVKAPPVKVPPVKMPPAKVAKKTHPPAETQELRDPDDPADEPGIEPIGTGVADEFAARDDDVFVVDGRPRFHLPSCAHLEERESEGVPVWEAFELGFTPCAQCKPVASLMAVRQ
jgi:hypothetical protein